MTWRVMLDFDTYEAARSAFEWSVPETYLLTTEDAPVDFVSEIEDTGTSVIPAGESRVDLPAAFDALEDRGIERTMVEGGGELIFSLFAAGLVDELSVFVGPTVIGGRDAPTLADGEGLVADFADLTLRSADRLDEGVVLSWDVP